MINEKKNVLAPQIRFPKFLNKGFWKLMQIGDILNVYSSTLALNKLELKQNGYSVYGADGIVGFIEKFQHKEPYISIVKDGSGVGRLKLCEKETSILGTLASLKSKDENKYILIWSFYLLNSIDFSSYVKGAGIPHIYFSDYKNVNVAVPTPEEQQKIADCLSSLDDLISAENQKLDALKAHKKGLMQQLFPCEGETVPKLRFEEFRGSGEWVIVSLIDVVDKEVKWSFTGGPFGSNLKASDYTQDGIRVIQLQNIGDGEFNNEYQIFTSPEKANELLSCNIYPGDLILSKMGDPVGRACIIPDFHKRYVMCSDGIRVVVNEKKFNKYFIFSLINSLNFRPLIEKIATGSTRKRVGLDDLKNLPMLVPNDVNEQLQIGNCLLSIDELIAFTEKKVKSMMVHKQSLMQQLFPIVK